MQDILPLGAMIRLEPSLRKPKGRTFQEGVKAAKALPEAECFHLTLWLVLRSS